VSAPAVHEEAAAAASAEETPEAAVPAEEPAEAAAPLEPGAEAPAEEAAASASAASAAAAVSAPAVHEEAQEWVAPSSPAGACEADVPSAASSAPVGGGRLGGLEETMSDPLDGAAREALTRLRQHEAAVRDVVAAVEGLAAAGSPATSEVELRRVAGMADRVEAMLGVPRDVLSREEMAQEWPAGQLTHARDIVVALDTFEASTSAASARLNGAGGEGGALAAGRAFGGLCEVVEKLLRAWTVLRDKELAPRPDIIRALKLNNGMRGRSLQPLCDALLDQVVETYDRCLRPSASTMGDLDMTLLADSAEGPDAAATRLATFLRQEHIQLALDNLGVELPTHDLFQLGSRTGFGDASRGPASLTDQAVRCLPLDATLGAVRALAAFQESSTAPSSPMEMSVLVSPTASLAAAAARSSGAAAAASDGAPGAAAAAEAAAASAAGGGIDQSIDMLQSTRDVRRVSVADGDPLSRTLPGGRLAEQRQGSTGLDDTRDTKHPMNASILGKDFHPTSGSPGLWSAVHVGDLEAVRELIRTEACTAKMRDASEHSVLWHAIAFGHTDIARLMLDTFPPGMAQGVDVSEIHPRKGDTLLHMLCQIKNFGSDMAQLFKRISAAMSPTLFQKVNYHGVTFLQLAAASMNFWVLTYVFKNLPVQAKALVSMPNHAPMKNLAEVVPQPVQPQFSPPEPFPEHFRISEMLQQDDDGTVPYADVAFDVGPERSGGAACRFLAHRVIVMSQSPALSEALEKAPMTDLPRERTRAAVLRVDARISQEVWRSVLQFMYTGVINFDFASDIEKVVELLRACALYKLPRPLQDFAQVSLYPLLPKSSPTFAVQVFTLSFEAVAEVRDAEFRSAREASAYLLLRSAHRIFEGAEPSEVAKILGRAVQVVENAIFNPVAPASVAPAASRASGGPCPMAMPPVRGPASDPMSQSLRMGPRQDFAYPSPQQPAPCAPALLA